MIILRPVKPASPCGPPITNFPVGLTNTRVFSSSNSEGITALILVDELKNKEKNVNLKHIKYDEFVERNDFLEWLDLNGKNVHFVFHLGARTDTTEQSVEVFNELNLNYSKQVFMSCVKHAIPLVYASSAATYGNGEFGYDDCKSILELKPLNPYGWSKQAFDLWVLEQENKPPFWVGLKFFNVYGKHENHKKRMASVVYHAYKQINNTGKMKLFMSHRDGIANGEQQRDFIAVEDIADVCFFFYRKQKNEGIYNLGSGEARTFNDLVKAVFKAMSLPVKIEYIPTPIDIRDSYQYYTQAEMKKLRLAGYDKAFTSLEDGVSEYVREFLMKQT